MNDETADAVSRLEALELHVAHQEKLLAELNDVLAAQWRKIDALERRIAQLREELQNMGPVRDGPETPPHY